MYLSAGSNSYTNSNDQFLSKENTADDTNPNINNNNNFING